MTEVNQPLPNLSNIVSKVKTRASAKQRPAEAPLICDNSVVPQIIIQDTELKPLTPLISDKTLVPEIIQDTILEPVTADTKTDLKFSVNTTEKNNSDPILSGGLDLFEESNRSNQPEEADKIEEDCSMRSISSNRSDIDHESSTLTLVSDPALHTSEVDSLPDIVNDLMSINLPGENVLFEKKIEEEKKEVRIVSVDDTISCFSHEGLIEELSDLEIKDQLVAGEPHLDPSRFVSYPDDLRPSFRLPQRLTSRRSTVFLQSSLCCCHASRERRESGSDNGGLSWLFCCFRTK